jgi:DNA-binding MarR family transcriptional regulator/N-acetylglutamate synthase-like GNAT family acetyltransferase
MSQATDIARALARQQGLIRRRTERPVAERVAVVRRFNRFYTRRIGVLNEALFGGAYSLAEMRILWELAHNEGISASWLEQELGMDAGYVSRILRGFKDKGLIASRPAAHDGRIRELRLTERGQKAFRLVDILSEREVRANVEKLSEAQRDRLTHAMGTIEDVLGAGRDERWSFAMRAPVPGDFGWVIARHGALYAREYGWDSTFEALVAEIVARYLRDHKPRREQAWIAEYLGERVGCVFLVERSAHVAQLRLLLVEPTARGKGIGRALVNECIRFAGAAGYRRVMLWTNSVLHAARHLYEEAGFKLVKQEKHHSFGHDLVGQTFSLSLGRGPG